MVEALAMKQDLWQCSAVELARLLRARAVSAVEIAEVLLDRIAAVDPMLHAYVTVDRDVTLGQARAAQAELDGGRDRGPLHGIPVSLKDAIDTAGMRTTWGSKAFEHRRPEADAFVTRKLRRRGSGAAREDQPARVLRRTDARRAIR